MMGQPMRSCGCRSMKGSNGVLALTAAETGPRARALHPLRELRRRLPLRPGAAGHGRAHPRRRPGRRRRSGLMDCIGCGSCAYVCPAHIPLVQFFNHAKGELAARGRAKQKQTETKRLAEARSARWRRRSGQARGHGQAQARGRGQEGGRGRGRRRPAGALATGQARPPIGGGELSARSRALWDTMTMNAPLASPHAHAPVSIGRTMGLVMLALMPATLFGLYQFGWPAIFCSPSPLAAACCSRPLALAIRPASRCAR
jgi:ferredoxin